MKLLFLLIFLSGCTANVQLIYELDESSENYIKWLNKEKDIKNELVTASVIGITQDIMYVYVDVIYSGDHGNEVTSCGKVNSNNKSASWSCSPVGIKAGRGFVVLRFILSDKVDSTIYSNSFEFNMYDNTGTVFYEKELKYKKRWSNLGNNLKK